MINFCFYFDSCRDHRRCNKEMEIMRHLGRRYPFIASQHQDLNLTALSVCSPPRFSTYKSAPTDRSFTSLNQLWTGYCKTPQYEAVFHFSRYQRSWSGCVIYHLLFHSHFLTSLEWRYSYQPSRSCTNPYLSHPFVGQYELWSPISIHSIRTRRRSRQLCSS
jgi:hypothetical protein